MFCPRCHREYERAVGYCAHDGEPLASAAKIEFVASEPCAEVGTVLDGRYAIRGFLGEGGMARVLLAEDLTTQGPVAIKVLGPPQARDATGRERFLREARAATAIGHANIAAVHDTGVWPGGAPYLVMEHLFGETLGSYLRRHGTLDGEVGLLVLRQAASALGAAHAVEIIHRDVKPDNLFLVGATDAAYDLKILDFGLAKLLAEGAFTAAGTAVGTMEYMAPEQAVTDLPDGRTDVYGLGVVMYRMFTGRLPFPNEGAAELLARHVIVPPEPPSATRPDLDRRVEAVILCALRKRVAHRYPSMEAFVADLDVLLGGGGGRLLAEEPLPLPDEYEPRSDAARGAVEFFRDKARHAARRKGPR